MLRLLIAALFVASSLGAATASTVDLTDGIYTTVSTHGATGDPVVFTELSDGVTFTFTALANLTGGARFSNFDDDIGMVLGGAGGSTIQFGLSVSSDITLNGYESEHPNLNLPYMDVYAGSIAVANLLSEDNALVDTAGVAAFDSGPLSLLSGTTYIFDINNSGPAKSSRLTALDFTGSVTSVPLPATLPLMLSGLAGIGLAFRRRKGVA